MNGIRILFSLFLLPSLLVPNACSSKVEYRFDVVDSQNLLLNDVEGRYREGEKIEIRLAFRSGPRVGVLIDGESYYGEATCQDDFWYESFVYTMPARDVTLYTTLDGRTGLEKTMDFTVSYDYGQYVQGKATKLLNLALLGLDSKIVTDSIAGDVLRMFYDGEIQFQETHPSKAVFGDDFRLVSMTYAEKATFCQVDLDSISSEEDSSYVLLDAEGNYLTLDEYKADHSVLYASVDSKTGKVYAYYGYEARYVYF